jgi:transcriptional regulator with XRE-family HTH domain
MGTVLDQKITQAARRSALPGRADRIQLRRRLGLTQRDLAESLGVSRSTVARLERHGRARREVVDRYAVALSTMFEYARGDLKRAQTEHDPAVRPGRATAVRTHRHERA